MGQSSVALCPANKKDCPALCPPAGEKTAKMASMAAQFLLPRLAPQFLLACLLLLPRLGSAQRGQTAKTARDGKYIERVQARYTDFKRGDIKNNWLPQKEPEGFNILFDALKKWRPSSSTNFVKVQYHDGRRYSVSSNEGSYTVPYNSKRNVCPKFPTRPSCSSYLQSTCWSPGVPDVDCPNHGLCCFNGCSNVCIPQNKPPLRKGTRPSRRPTLPPQQTGHFTNADAAPASSTKPQLSYNNIFNTYQGQNAAIIQTTRRPHTTQPANEQYEYIEPSQIQSPDATPSQSDPNKCLLIQPQPASACLDTKANCWSAGVLDLDCPDSGLCCFDGCVNTCVDKPSNASLDIFEEADEALADNIQDELSDQQDADQLEETYPDLSQDTPSPSLSDNPYQCPAMAPKSPYACVNKKANCWSAGVLDLDCPDYGLCCFDGCVNSCVDQLNEAVSLSNPQDDELQLDEVIPEKAQDAPKYSDPNKCPFLTPKPKSECKNRKANCWSVNVPDLDCPNYGLCCYDGCVNSCIDMPAEYVSESSPELSQEQHEEISPDPAQDTALHSDNHQDNSEQPDQTILDPPQETLSYSDNPDKCTVVTPKSANSCLNKKANCWSAGVPDLDCPNSGLCCFDGCVNTCIDTPDDLQSESIPEASEEILSAPSTEPDEIYDVPLADPIDDYDPVEIDDSIYNPQVDSYGSPTADPVKLEGGQFSSTEHTKDSNDIPKIPAPTQSASEDIFSGPFEDTNTYSDPAHGANIDTINNEQITDITEKEPSDVANSDEFVFPLSSSSDPIQNTIMLLLDTYGPPKTNQAKPVELQSSSYNPHIDSYGSPTADPVKLQTGVSSHYSSTENTQENNDIDHYRPSQYNPIKLIESASTVSVYKGNNLSHKKPSVDGVTLTKTSHTKSPTKPVKQKVLSNYHQQADFTNKYTGAVNYGSKLSHTKLQHPRKHKPKPSVNYASIDGYGSPLADPIRNVEKHTSTRKNAYLNPIQSGLRPAVKPNNKFSPIFYESVRLTTPRSNLVYRPKEKYVKKILKKKYVKNIKQQSPKPSEQKSSLGKFWERHFGFFPILEQPTTKPSTARPSSCPEVQSRSSEECKLNYQNYCTKLGKHDRMCPYDDICCYDGCANRCLNWKQPQNVFFRDSVGVFVQ